MNWWYRLAIVALLVGIAAGIALLIVMFFVGAPPSPDEDECCTQLRGCQRSTAYCPQ